MKQRILVVDDEPQILRALQTNLRGAGYEVETAATAEQALAAAALKPPDAVIVDLVLPDRSGTEVTRELRRWSSAPILVLSVVGEEREKVAALEDPHHWILQKKVEYASFVLTPDGPKSKAELRMMFVWSEQGEPVLLNNLVRMSQGKMMGVDFNKDKTWVGSSIALHES